MHFSTTVVLVASAANAVFPGEFQSFKGTSEEVYAKPLTVNRYFKAPNVVETRGLKEKRSSLACGGQQPANKKAIGDGAAYLRNLPPGNPTNGPGPNNCVRVSCSYNSAIWWCNDSIAGWNWIANSAQYITEVCDPGSDQTSGSNHEDGDWSTIVQGDRCQVI